ncbi:protein Niban 1a [Poecilia latipinna]|uniref:Niban apoptosis regulator 1a n=1 Tax=Poecilia latipinna TaxID=48699 RepID=A0A3B3VH90_9TELE|nr:PREDICTED: protein Niban-like [Poecilia latipinna]
MGVSASSLLDEAKSAYIRGQAEAELSDFAPYYRKQFSVARFAQVEDELQQNKQQITQLLEQKKAPEEAIVLYDDAVWYFDDSRKWRERIVVVRANYCLECHESLQSYVKGANALYKLLPTGGTILTTEEKYMEMVDKCYPDDSNVKEEFAPPLPGMPGQFPVYLRLPYRRDYYFCFKQEAKRATFISFLSDCIKHQNQDFQKKKTCEVQAFLKAIQLFRQDRGQYEAWGMLIGSDVRVMANLVMEKLLPSLGKDLLPRLRAKKTDRKKAWFITMEAAYILVQEHLLEGLAALKEECKVSVQQQEVLMRSDMDQILNTRRQLEEKIRAKVSEPAEQLCSESVQPYLGSVLEELMEPISSGFMASRQLMETKMDEVYQAVLQGADNDKLKQALGEMARPNLLDCCLKISSLQGKLKHLQERFGFSTLTAVTHGAQIDLQQLMENAAYTLELMLKKAMEDNPETAGAVMDKAKHRILKQFDYDSSTVRKRIFQEALVSIMLPFIKKNLADSCKPELQGLEQTVYTDYANFIHVENVYENILLQILDKEVSKVVKEAASLHKHNLFKASSRASLSSMSTPSSPAPALASSIRSPSQAPPSPLAVSRPPPSPTKGAEPKRENVGEVLQAAETLLKEVEPTADRPDAKLPAAEGTQTLKVEVISSAEPKPPSAETLDPSEPQIQENLSVQAEEPRTQRTDQQEAETTSSEPPAVCPEPPAVCPEPPAVCPEPPAVSPEVPTAAEPPAPELSSPDTLATIAEPLATVEPPEPSVVAEPPVSEPSSASEPPSAAEPSSAAEPPSAAEPSVVSEAPSLDQTDEPVDLPAEETGSQPAAASQQPSAMLAAPPGGEEAEDVSLKLQLKTEDTDSLSASDPNSLAVSVRSDSPRSDLESTEGTSETSELLEVQSALSPEETSEDQTSAGEPSVKAQTGEVEAGATAESPAEPDGAAFSPPAGNGPGEPDVRPPDCVKEIRNLVVEVIEVEEPMHQYPKEE